MGVQNISKWEILADFLKRQKILSLCPWTGGENITTQNKSKLWFRLYTNTKQRIFSSHFSKAGIPAFEKWEEKIL